MNELVNVNKATIKDGIAALGLFEKNKDVWVSSRDLAIIFEKNHKDVLRAINDILAELEPEIGQRIFAPSSYKTSQGKRQPEYLMNRKGFTLAAMGFTGKKALDFKLAYIEAFEAMVNLIETRFISKQGYKEMSSAVSRYIGSDRLCFSAEADMINKIVLKMTSSQFKELNGLKENESPRDSVVADCLNRLDRAQRLNAQLIVSGMSFDARKSIIEKNFKE